MVYIYATCCIRKGKTICLYVLKGSLEGSKMKLVKVAICRSKGNR